MTNTKEQTASIEVLKTIATNKQREYHEAKDKLEAAMEKQALPQSKKDFEGKYFKFRNSYGGDRKWWLYRKVQKVTSADRATVFEFQDDTDGKISFELDAYAYLRSSGFIPCTKAEFDREYKKTLKKLNP